MITAADGGEATIDPKDGDSVTVLGAVVLDPGQGYLQRPDGSSNFPSGPNDTIIRTPIGGSFVVPPGTLVGGPDSEYNINIPSSQEVELNPEENSTLNPEIDPANDSNAVLVFMAAGLPPMPIYNVDTGIQTDTIVGEGIEIGIPIPPNSTFTTPTLLTSDPSTIQEEDGIGVPESSIPFDFNPEVIPVGENNPSDNTNGIVSNFVDGVTSTGQFNNGVGRPGSGTGRPGSGTGRPGSGTGRPGSVGDFTIDTKGTGNVTSGIGFTGIDGVGRIVNGDGRPTVDGQPVDVIIEAFYIDNPGANYSPGDEVIISPSNGVEVRPVFNNVGQLVNLNIENPGGTFTTVPKIFIRSQTGVNANIIPIFVVRRDEGPDERLIEATGDRIISVVDCVGPMPRSLYG